MVAMKATIYHWNEYAQEFLPEVLWSVLSLPRAVPLFGFCCVRARVELRFECECKCRMVLLFVIQSYLHSCTTRCDVMWCHNVMYNTEIIKILTLRVQIALSLRQDLNIIVSLAPIGKPNMILYNPIFVLCMQ